MAIVFDLDKSARNASERGLAFHLVERAEWETAIVKVDDRRDYGETRLRVLALMDGRLHAVVVTPRDGDLRVVSFRKANGREVRAYEAGRGSSLTSRR